MQIDSHDTFGGGNGGGLDQRVPDLVSRPGATPWQWYHGAADLQEPGVGHVELSGVTAQSAHSLGAPRSYNYRVGINYQLLGRALSGVTARGVGNPFIDGWCYRLWRRVHDVGGFPFWRLSKILAGVEWQLAFATLSTGDASGVLELEVSGPRIRAFMDGGLVADVFDDDAALLTTGHVGMVNECEVGTIPTSRARVFSYWVHDQTAVASVG